MFNEVSYWQEIGPEISKPVRTFSSLFDANSSAGQLSLELDILADAFKDSPLSRLDFLLQMGNFFWSVGSGRCAYEAYKLARKLGTLPEREESRYSAIKKSPFREKMFVITGELFQMERPEALFEIRKRGGLTSDNPVNSMDFLVVGSQEWSEMNGGVASRKIQKAAELQKKGRKISIISEEDFYSMLHT